MTYKTLQAGDVREIHDEVRHLDLAGNIPCAGALKNPNWSYKDNQYAPYDRHPKLGEWEKVQLVGHKILQSDLIAAEFRRAV